MIPGALAISQTYFVHFAMSREHRKMFLRQLRLVRDGKYRADTACVLQAGSSRSETVSVFSMRTVSTVTR